jgi:hypothetical protein
MTNYEFLLRLNLYGGRSFHGSENYPVLPWVAFGRGRWRSLRWPIGAQTDACRALLARTLRLDGADAYLFGSAPSAPMLLAFFFVRLQPFTALHREIHDGHFDSPDRMFASVERFLESCEALTECKEAAPEFYAMPEALIGQRRAELPDLNFPNWAPNAFELVHFNRIALEAPHVSQFLNEWVDLVFGVAQESRERLNVFLSYLYGDVWERRCDEDAAVVESMLSNLGSIPPIVFADQVPPRSVHPLKKPATVKFDIDVAEPRAIVIGSYGHGKLHAIVRVRSGELYWVTQSSDSDRLIVAKKCEIIVPENSVLVEANEVFHAVDFTSGTLFTFSFGNDISRTKSAKCKTRHRWRPAGVNSLQLFGIDHQSQLFLFDLERPAIIRRVAQFSRFIRCSAMSVEFDRFVACTEDCVCEIYTLHNTRLLNSHPLARSVGTKVLITEGLGLILVKAGERLWLFTVNGFLIRELPFPIEVEQWTAWCDRGGADAVVCADEQGRIFVFDAFRPEDAAVLGTVDATVIGLSFEPHRHTVVAVTARSTAWVFPARVPRPPE